MSYSNTTPNYSLPQWASADVPSYLVDFNGTFAAIDTAMKNNADAAGNAQADATNAGNAAGTAQAAANGALAGLAPNYSNNNTYAVGDLAIYNYTLYRCNTAINTPESFNVNKWDAVNLALFEQEYRPGDIIETGYTQCSARGVSNGVRITIPLTKEVSSDVSSYSVTGSLTLCSYSGIVGTYDASELNWVIAKHPTGIHTYVQGFSGIVNGAAYNVELGTNFVITLN